MANRCFSGLHMAKVDHVGDKDNPNKVKATLVSEGEKGVELDFAPVLTNSAGENYGIVSLPKKDDFVIVAFLDNDIRRPVVLGSIPTPTRKPPLKVNGDNNNTKRMHKTADGLEFTIEEKENASKITIKTKSGHVFTWDDSSGKNSISFKSKNKKTAISIDIEKSVIELKADTIKLTADTKEVAVKSGGSTFKVSNASGVDLKSPKGKFAVNVNSMNCQATSTAKLAANAEVTVQGGMAALKANSMAQVKGATVMIG